MSNGPQGISLAMARMIAAAILLSMCIMTALGVAIATGAIPAGGPLIGAEQARTARVVFLAIGLAPVLLSHVVRKALDGRAAAAANPASARHAAMIIGMAFGEMPSTLALVCGILLHDVTTTLLLGAAAIVTGLSHFPRTGSIR
ncbi:MAG: hypothetical protein FJY92_09500 [Candidatus Hydrogenedentes bacterium]|nr:hypothetical protein [Candidatus Hydrogenedentota bacterium]